jgi:hypothetical protein
MADIDTIGPKALNIMRLEYSRSSMLLALQNLNLRLMEMEVEKAKILEQIESQKTRIKESEDEIENMKENKNLR